MTDKELKQIESDFSKKLDALFRKQKIDAMVALRERLNCINTQTLSSTFIIDDLIKHLDLHGYVVSKVYEAYSNLCDSNNVSDKLDKIGFSKYICRWYSYCIVDKKIKRKKLRLFCKTE